MEGYVILKPLVTLWNEKIQKAKKVKHEKFGKYAEECMQFLDGPHDFVFESRGESHSGFKPVDPRNVAPTPMFGVTVNKASEVEQLFGPVVYHKNPIPLVRPRNKTQFDNFDSAPLQELLAPLQQETIQRRAIQEIRAKCMETYLTYVTEELDLQSKARLAVSEALVKGRGLLWPEVYQFPGQRMKLVGAFYDSVDNLIIDPDRGLSDAMWIARARCQPWWEVERKFNLPSGMLREYATRESSNQQAKTSVDQHGAYRRAQGGTNDLIEYWEVYSKMGVGDRLSGAPENLSGFFDQVVGDYVYLAVCAQCPWFLNVPEELMQMPLDEIQGELMQRFSWPTPFWAEGGWPFRELDPHPHVTEAWPTSHLRPALGELRFIDWATSFLMDTVAVSSRQFIAVAKEASEEFKRQIESGSTMTIIEFETSMQKTVNELVQFLQHPQMNPDLMNVVRFAIELFDKRTGLTELFFGQTAAAMRSAEEAGIKADMVNIRPGDIAEKVEVWMKRVYRDMAMCARWHLRAEDIAPVLGPQHAMVWQQLITSSSVEEVTRELDYSVEAGSARKPNKQRDQENMSAALQTIFPVANNFAMQTGDMTVMNQLLRDWAIAQSLDPERYAFQPPEPAPAPEEEMPPEGAPVEGQPAEEPIPA